MRWTAWIAVAVLVSSACTPTVETTTTVTTTTTFAPSTTAQATTTTASPSAVVFNLTDGFGITIGTGGDVDYEVVAAGPDSDPAVRSGNGSVLASSDANQIEDYYLMFSVDDTFLYATDPTSRIHIEVEFLDTGTDTWNIQYDALSGGPFGNGTFKDTALVTKTDTGDYRTAIFPLCDANFANRHGGADFRIADSADGAEIIRSVTVRLVEPYEGQRQIAVDSCGADPFDDEPDSEAIQSCIDQTCDGDTVLFTSPAGRSDYRGYSIDRTVFLARLDARRDLTFTSTAPDDHALLVATADLRGFVVRLYARSAVSRPGDIDGITISHLDIDGNRAERVCAGPDRRGDGVGDNWGSWLPECDVVNDPWCSPGGLAMEGFVDGTDPEQAYEQNPHLWSTGLVVQDMRLTNNECATMLAFTGAAGLIERVAIDTAGDHVHGAGCAATDPDEPPFAWSDGITFFGPANVVTNNVVLDASDIGIVSFGGRDTTISFNRIEATPGNHGMFAGIAVHPWWMGILSGFTVVGNEVVNDADSDCGGIHAGINIGGHMWGSGCVRSSPAPTAVGTPGACSSLSPPPGLTFCDPGQPCRVWGLIRPGETLTLADNSVTGAQINYLIGGIEVQGELITSNNTSTAPRMTDWEGDTACEWDGLVATWGAVDRVAHDPVIPGWADIRVYCER